MSETFVLRWVLKGGISISRVPALSLDHEVRLDRHCFPSRGPGPVHRAGNVVEVFKYRVFPFGTLLGPETTGPRTGTVGPDLPCRGQIRAGRGFGVWWLFLKCSCAGPRRSR